MYNSFFGLRERPFSLAPDPRFLFLPPAQKEALSMLHHSLSSRSGLTLLLGEAGTGKTTLVQAALGEFGNGDEVQCLLLSNPTLTRSEFYEYLAHGFGLGSDAAASKARFLLTLRGYLQDRCDRDLLTALLLDEAQSLPHELLEEVRLLSNVETPTTKLLNVVLIGQPELAARLNEPNLRQLKQRIALRCELAPLSLRDSAAYIAGRLRIAGGMPVEIFTREAVETIHTASAGIPRVINVICDNALIGGFAAQVKPVSRAIVEDVCRDFDLRASTDADSQVPPQPALPSATTVVDEAPPPLDEPVEPETTSGRLLGVFGQKRRSSFF